MLLPALAAAREKARRSSCVNNLKQMGVAFESYTGDYSGYVPFNVTWDLPLTQCNTNGVADAGEYKDPRSPRPHAMVHAWVQCSPASRYHYRSIYGNARFQSRVIAQGQLTGVWYSAGYPADYKLGNLAMAPQGLGFLAASDYVSDLDVFYCPTSTNMPDEEYYKEHSIVWSTSGHVQTLGATSLSEVRAAGGTESRILTHGNWNDVGKVHEYNTYYAAADQSFGRRLYSNYAYRGAGVYWEYEYYFANFPGSPHHRDGTLRTPWTKPEIRHDPFLPFFKTTKQLGGRALVVDGYGRPEYYMVPRNEGRPGTGWYGHREGYNVLYNGGHAKWFGDPQQRLMWWDQAYYSNRANEFGANYPLDPAAPSYAAGHDSRFADVWHTFDVEAGIDVDAERGR